MFGKCGVKNADGKWQGKVIFHQQITDAGELEPTSISARVKGAAADRVAIELYSEDPQNLTAADRTGNFGEFRPNARNVVTVFGLYNDEASLQGGDSLEGQYIGIRCVESGNLVGSCQITTKEMGGE